MKWLARIDVDARTAYEIKSVDSYAWHQRIWDCFPGIPEEKRSFLTRIDEQEDCFRLWVLSPKEPVCPSWASPDTFTVKEITSSFLAHRVYHFDVKANPTKCISTPDADGKMPRHGKRVPLNKPEDLEKWIDRKGETGGFRIVKERSIDIGPMVQAHFRKKEQRGYHGGVRFRGTLEVVDSGKFAEAYSTGIGSAKGFGFGLLLLAPVNK